MKENKQIAEARKHAKKLAVELRKFKEVCNKVGFEMQDREMLQEIFNDILGEHTKYVPAYIN